MNRLLVPALDRGGAAEVLLGFLTGGLVLGVSDVVIPHAHARLREGARQPVEQRAAEHRAALEGFAAAAPLIPAGTSPRTAAGVAALTGMVEPPAAFAGFALVELAGAVLAAALGFAAGAMLYVIVDELIPESHAGGHELAATSALLLGFVVMVGLDTTL